MSNRSKACSRCGEEKLLSDFYKNRSKKDGRSSECRVCGRQHRKENIAKYRVYCKEWSERNPQAGRKNRLKQYNLTLVDYNRLHTQQKGLCAICGLPATARVRGRVKSLSVDHNHRTGEVRGLLCVKCNTAIGSLNVDNLGILNLQMAIRYLKSVGVK